MWLILKICFMSSVFTSWSIVYRCTCSSCHIIAVDIYICSIRRCGALLTQPDRRGVTTVLPVGGWTSVAAGVFRWVQVAAVGLQAAACLGVVGATDSCTAGAVGACCSCTASEVDGVVTGCPATSTLVCVSDLTASWWHSWIFMNVVLCLSILSSTNDSDNLWAMIGCMHYSGRGHSVPSLLITKTDCPA